MENNKKKYNYFQILEEGQIPLKLFADLRAGSVNDFRQMTKEIAETKKNLILDRLN